MEQIAGITSDRVQDVVNAYIHGLIGRYPRARYLVGMDAKMAIFINSLPEWLADEIFLISGRNMIPQCCKK